MCTNQSRLPDYEARVDRVRRASQCELMLHVLAACAQLMDTCDAGICAVTHLAASTARMSFAASSRPDRNDHVATARHGIQDSLVADRGILRTRRCAIAEGDMRGLGGESARVAQRERDLRIGECAG
mgnify:CR=1 FL=1